MEALLDRFKGAIIVALVASVAAGGGLLMGRQPTRQPIVIATAAPTPTVLVTIKVHVSGAVAAPGVYTMRLGDRIEDAIAAAGGATADGDPGAQNLAARLVDGQQVVVAKAGEAAAGRTPTAAGQRLVSINAATLAELDTLPGIGQVTGQKIIDYRNKNGPFRRIEELVELKIMPASTFEKIRDMITL